MSDIGFDDAISERLEGTHSFVGGLILKGNSKKSSQTTSESVLGLKKLAEEKRKRKRDEHGENAKRVKDLSADRGADDIDWEKGHSEKGLARLSSGNKDFKSRSRHYRSALVETPSHTGGVNEEIREKQLRRLERDRETRKGGVYAESRLRDRDDKYSRRDRERYKDDDREKRKYDKSKQTSSRSHDYNIYRGDKDDSFKEPRTSRSEWEETPYRKSRSSRDEGYSTPRHKTKGMLSDLQDKWMCLKGIGLIKLKKYMMYLNTYIVLPFR